MVTFARHGDRHDVACNTWAVGARTVKWQFGFGGSVGETTAPEVEVGVIGGGQRGAMGCGNRRVLDGQGFPVGCVRVDACAVGGGEIARERGQRPSVRREMMDDDDQRVIVGRRAQEPCADGEVTREVERL